MRALTFPGSQTDWSFRIGLGLVISFAALELIGITYHYAGKIRGAHRVAPASVAATAPTPAPAVPAVAPPVAPSAAPSVAAAASPSTATLSVADRLLNEATALRERGDTTNALARLQEAEQKDPTNARVLAEMAAIYESIQLYDRSNETWRKIEALGPSVGSLYDLAQTKLKLGAAAPGLANPPAAASPSAPPAEGEVAASAPAGSEGGTRTVHSLGSRMLPSLKRRTRMPKQICFCAFPSKRVRTR